MKLGSYVGKVSDIQRTHAVAHVNVILNSDHLGGLKSMSLTYIYITTKDMAILIKYQ